MIEVVAAPPPELLEAIDQAARAQERTRREQIRWLLRRALELERKEGQRCEQ